MIINSITPTSIPAGSDAFTLAINGANFVNGAKVKWDGSERTTIFVSSSKLNASILKSDIVNSGDHSITGVNPDGGITDSVIFKVTSTISNLLPAPILLSPGNPSSPGPTLDTLTPDFTWSLVTGADKYNIFINDTATSEQHTFEVTTSPFHIPSGKLKEGHSYRWNMNSHNSLSIENINYGTGWGTLNATSYYFRTFTVSPTQNPSITSLSPDTTLAGSDEFTLTVNGANFVSGAKVKWGGSDRETTFISSSKLTTKIMITDVSKEGSHSITVVNPDGTVSNEMKFEVSSSSSSSIQILPEKPFVGQLIKFGLITDTPISKIQSLSWYLDGDKILYSDKMMQFWVSTYDAAKHTLRVEWVDDTGTHILEKEIDLSLDKGTILFARNRGGGTTLDQGYWKCVAIYIGNNEVISSEQNDYTYMTPGGVQQMSLSDWLKPSTEYAACKVTDASYDDIEMAITYAESKVGSDYDYFSQFNPVGHGKQFECGLLTVGCKQYYSAELVWAAFRSASVNLNLDPDGDNKINNGVTVDEIWNSPHTQLIGYNKWFPEITLTEIMVGLNELVNSIPARIEDNMDLLYIHTKCPVDLTLIDPAGNVINKTIHAVPDSYIFQQDYNNDGDPEDIIVVEHPKSGDYQIFVSPKPGAKPDDVYSVFYAGGNSSRSSLVTLAENTSISNILDSSYVVNVNNPVSFTASPTSGVPPLSVSFTDTSSETMTLWYWDFGDCMNSTQQNPIHLYSTVGTYNVTLIAGNQDYAQQMTRSNCINVTLTEQTPPNVTDLFNSTYHPSSITWTWTDPTSTDYDHVMVYLNGVFQENVTKGAQTFTASSLTPATSYMIGTHTVGTIGLINSSWVNHTAMTAPPYSGPSFNVLLNNGWNVFSTPLQLDQGYSQFPQIFSGDEQEKILIILGWDGSHWYIPAADEDVKPLDAFYVKVSQGEIANATIVPSKVLSSPPAREVTTGINLIGFAPAYDPGTQLFNDMPLNQALASIEFVEGSTGYTMVISPSLNQPGWTYAKGGQFYDMLPFKGYWVIMENGPDTLYGFSTTPISN